MVSYSFPPPFVRQGVPVRRQDSWVGGCLESRIEEPSTSLLPTHTRVHLACHVTSLSAYSGSMWGLSAGSTTLEDRVARAMLAARHRRIVPIRVPPLAFLRVMI